MYFEHLNIEGAFSVELNKIEDERGFFARIFCQKEFAAENLNSEVVQANLSHNRFAGTLRGMHYQLSPALETKFVRCVQGSILDVIVDLRPDSPSYLQHCSIELTASSGRALFVPASCAHGFMTLEDHSDVLYLVSGFYSPAHERGLRHDDPALGIRWPQSVEHISDKDRSWPLLQA